MNDQLQALLQALWQAAAPIVLGQIRHLIGAVGAILVFHGALRTDQDGAFTDIAYGLVMYAGAALWSMFQKVVIPRLQAQLADAKKQLGNRGQG